MSIDDLLNHVTEDFQWEEPPAILTVLDQLRSRVNHWARIYSGLTPARARTQAGELEALDPMIRTAVGPVKEAKGPWGVWARCLPEPEGKATPPPAPVKVKEDPREQAPTPLKIVRPVEPVAAAAPAAPAPARPSRGKNLATAYSTDLEAAGPAPEWVQAFIDSRAFMRANPGARAPLTDVHYAKLAATYVELLAKNFVPSKVMANWLGISTSGVSDRVADARNRGLLTAAPNVKRPGGELTQKARDLISGRLLPSVPPPAKEGHRFQPKAPAAPPEPDANVRLRDVPTVRHLPTPSTAPITKVVIPAAVAPTAEQQRQIDALNAENKAHVESLQAPDLVSESGARLPATCKPVFARDMPAHLQGAAQAAIAAGWLIGLQGNNHYRWCGPKGEVVATGATSNNFGQVEDVQKLRRFGVPVPQAAPSPKAENVGKADSRPAPEALVAEAKRMAVVYSTRYKDGLPEDVTVTFHPDVLALYGTDLDVAMSCVRSPERVEPDLTFKERTYPVLRFVRGDVTAVMGFRTPATPMAIGVYVNSRLKHSEHEVDHSGGGGGSRRAPGLPTTVNAMLRSLASQGVVVTYDPVRDKVAECAYKDQALGKVNIEAGTSKAIVTTDYQRIVRKVSAINRVRR